MPQNDPGSAPNFAEFLKATTLSLVDTANLTSVLHSLVQQIGVYAGWPVGHIYFATDPTGSDPLPSLIWYFRDPEKYAVVRDGTNAECLKFDLDVFGGQLRERQSVCIANAHVSKDFARGKQMAVAGLRDYCAFPLLSGTRLVGVMEFFSESEIVRNPVLEEFITFLSSILGQNIERKRMEDALRRQTHDLGERIKELRCLYAFTQLTQDSTRSMDALCRGLAELFPQALQYPMHCCARVEFEGQVFQSPNFRESRWRLGSEIWAWGRRVGGIEAFYLGNDMIGAAGPFLKEEQELLDALAAKLAQTAEHRQAERALNQSEERFRAQYKGLPVPTFSWQVAGDDFVVTDLNNAADKFIQGESKKLLGKTAREVYSHVPDFIEDLRQCALARSTFQRERNWRMVTTGEQKVLRQSFAFVEPDLILVHIEDVTERVREERERKLLLEREHAARTEAERANRAKDLFMATLSHQLRSPLTGILSWAQLLRSTPSDAAKVAVGAERIEQCALGQSQLINDLLDVSRIIMGKLELKRQPISIVQLLLSATEAVRPAAERKAIALETRMPGVERADSARIAVDPARFQQILWHLLTNAIAFTPEGGRVWLDAREKRGESWEISVSDTGAGIAPEDLPKMFDLIEQLGDASSSRSSHQGLGLLIVRNLIALHGGTVTAESLGPGKGSVFTIQLPYSAVALSNGGAEVETAERHELSLKDVRILIVDDDPGTCEAISLVLRSHHADVRMAGNADEALSLLRWGIPDVLISDLAMPGKDGIALIREIRAAGDPVAGLPAIALTGYADEAARQRALGAGFDSHIAKPVDSRALAELVVKLIRSRSRAPS